MQDSTTSTVMSQYTIRQVFKNRRASKQRMRYCSTEYRQIDAPVDRQRMQSRVPHYPRSDGFQTAFFY